jgi:hypothetical protein
MGSLRERPNPIPSVIQDIFEQHFPILKTPKNDTREEDEQEGRQREKKRRGND